MHNKSCEKLVLQKSNYKNQEIFNILGCIIHEKL